MLNALKFLFENRVRYNYFFTKELKAIRKQRNWEPATLRALQEQKFVALVHRAYHKSPFYRHLYDLHGVNISEIKTLQDIERLPIVNKEAIRNHIGAIFIGSRLNRSTAHTSGTTGSPMTLYRDYQSITKEAAYLWAHRMNFGYEVGMKTVTLRGNLGKKQMELLDPHSNTLYLSSYNLSPDNAEWYYERIRDFAPHALLAYPSSLATLANYFDGMEKSLRVPLVFTSSETVYAHQREKVEEVFNTRIIDWYGNAERTIALEQNVLGLYDELPLYSVNEFRDDHAITTGLINESFPLIRYQVDDVFVVSGSEAGKPKVVESIQGRSNDYLVLPDGSRVGLLCNTLKGINHLLFAQIVQRDTCGFTVNVVVDEDFGLEDEQQIRTNISRRVGDDVPFDIAHVCENEIIKSPAGKYKLIINQLAASSESELMCS
jgi:phenylacetate-CoA ligase